MYLLLILTTIVIYVIWTILDRRGKPPGPFGLPVVGCLPFFDSKKPYETLTKLSAKYGSIFGLHMGQVYAVVLTDPSLIRDALKREELTGRAPLFITHGIMGGQGKYGHPESHQEVTKKKNSSAISQPRLTHARDRSLSIPDDETRSNIVSFGAQRSPMAFEMMRNVRTKAAKNDAKARKRSYFHAR